MIGVIDESPPWLTDDRDEVLYSLALVVIADELHDDVRTRLRSRLNRKRPFHWEFDVGPNVRAKVIDELTASASAVVAAAAGCQRKDQTETRRRLLDRLLLPAAFDSGVTRLVIERNWSRASGRGWRPIIDHVDKTEPLTWMADAASGIWSDALLDRDRGILAPLVGSRLIRSSTWTPRTER